MAVHHGGRVGKAAKALASKGPSKTAKSSAGKVLAAHKAKHHKKSGRVFVHTEILPGFLV